MRLLLLTFLCFMLSSVHGQHTWRFGSGYLHRRILDEQNSPLIYRAHAALLSATYERSFQSDQWVTETTLAVGGIQNTRFGQQTIVFEDPVDLYGNKESYVIKSNPRLSYINPRIRSTYAWQVTKGQERVFLGPALEVNFEFSGIAFDTWFFGNSSLSPQVIWIPSFVAGQRMTVRLESPIMSFVLREPYAKDPSIPLRNYPGEYLKQSPGLVSFGSFRKVHCDLGYTFLLGNKWAGNVGYLFEWMVFEEPRRLSSYSHQFTLLFNRSRA